MKIGGGGRWGAGGSEECLAFLVDSTSDYKNYCQVFVYTEIVFAAGSCDMLLKPRHSPPPLQMRRGEKVGVGILREHGY